MKKLLYLFLAAFTILFLVSCHKETNEINVSEIVDIQESAVDMLNNLSTPGASGETVINNCIQQLLTNPEVSSAHFQSPDQIVIKYKSGATGIILFVGEAEEQEKNIPKSTNPTTKNQDDAVRITNNKVLIWDWFNNIDEYDETDALRNLFNSCSDINFEVDIKQGNECTAQSLNNLTQYGFIYIATHGGTYSDNGEELCYIVTGQWTGHWASPTSLITNEDIANGNYLLVTIVDADQAYINNATFAVEGTYWGVSNKYISKYVTGTFSSPAIVFVAACKSFHNNSLRNAFINDKNASFYLGYSESVSTEFAYNKGIEFVTNMLQKRLSALDAYDEIDVKTDTYINKSNLLKWLNNGYLPPRAMLKYSKKENLTYFTEEDDSSLGQLICDDGRTYPLHSCHYSPGGSLTFLHSNAESEPSYVMAFYSLTMCNTELGNFHPLQPSSTNEWMNLNSNDPWGFWVKNSCSDVSSRLSIAGGGSIKMTNGEVLYNSNTGGFSFSFTDEEGHNWVGTYNGPVS